MMNTLTAKENLIFAGVDIKGNDPRMRFRNSQDPIYVAYNYIDNQPLDKLAKAFVKDQVKGVIKFISKVTNQVPAKKH